MPAEFLRKRAKLHSAPSCRWSDPAKSVGESNQASPDFHASKLCRRAP